MRVTGCIQNISNVSCSTRTIRFTSIRLFSSSTRRLHDDFPNHYETLSIQHDATEKDIKKQFYTLSKAYHPDLHPNDPNASKRFVQISEAYAVLSSPDKRKIYDRDYARVHQTSSSAPAYPTGSFSSASTPAGGRPASGLSRRRTQFRGPPPSFYQSGGWGEQGAKRAEYASRPSHSWEGQDDTSTGAGQGMPGVGPGGFAHGLENDVPHFDSRGHYQTHSTIERTRHKARRRVQANTVEEDSSGGSGTVLGFLSVLGMFGLAFSIAAAIGRETQRPTKATTDDKS